MSDLLLGVSEVCSVSEFKCCKLCGATLYASSLDGARRPKSRRSVAVVHVQQLFRVVVVGLWMHEGITIIYELDMGILVK